MSRIIISGPSGGAPNRLEINDFIKNDKFFSLYIQALQSVQKVDQTNPLSAFQIGGIHGLPYVPWNGVAPTRGWAWGGYCTHGSVLFPTWHRPYISLYEQIIQQRAKEIAATYTVDQAAWKKAADDLRQPYWDWAVTAVPPPQVISQKQVTITAPNGQKTSVDNPLYHYTFHPIDPSFRTPYKNWRTTLRNPTSSRPDATDGVARLQSVLASSQSDITSGTYNMLTRVNTWAAFSNHSVGDGGSDSNSLEAIHDEIHGLIGGHMGDPSVAAFDPIFYLHHCNVDRLLSLWSALNPGVWVSANEAEDGTFAIPPGSPVNATTPLTPFSNGQNTFWASAGTTDTGKLGYTYPDFNGLDTSNPANLRVAIARRVNQLYGSSVFGSLAVDLASLSSATTTSTSSTPQALAVAADTTAEKQQPMAKPVEAAPQITQSRSIANPSVTAAAAPPQAAAAPHAAAAIHEVSHASAPHGHGPVVVQPSHHHGEYLPPNRGLYEWTARIECKKFELSGSYTVLIFLGAVPEDPKEWQVSPNYVGSHYAFVNSAAEECEACRNKADIVIEGFVHLNKAIVRHSGLQSLEPDVVLPYLTKNLHWRVLKAASCEPATLRSLEVTIHATPLSYPPGAVFPVPGESHRYDRVTRGRDGGSRHPPNQ